LTEVHLGLGSNLGDRRANLAAALRLLSRMLRIEAVSSLYETEPVGGPPQAPFYNAVVRAECGLAPLALLRFVKNVETELGRRPYGQRWGPRPIDIDLLLHGDTVLQTPELELPHPRLAERAFVLAPLAELAPDLAHPVLGKTVGELLKAVDASGVRVIEGAGWEGQLRREASFPL